MFDKAQRYLIRTERFGGFDPNHYATLLKEDIADKLKYDLWRFREYESSKFISTYGMCTHIMKIVENTVKSI